MIKLNVAQINVFIILFGVLNFAIGLADVLVESKPKYEEKTFSFQPYSTTLILGFKKRTETITTIGDVIYFIWVLPMWIISFIVYFTSRYVLLKPIKFILSIKL